MDVDANPFPSRLRPFVGVLGAAVAALAVLDARRGTVCDIGAIVVLVALVVLAEHRAVPLPQGVLVSGGFMVGMAAIVVLVEKGFVLGPLLVGLASGVYLPHLRRGRWAWIPFNAVVLALAYCAAGAVYEAMPHALTGALPAAILGAIPPTLAYVAVNLVLLCGSYAVEGLRDARAAARELTLPSLQAFPLAILGVALGRLYLDIGAAAALLIVVPILVAREMFQGSIDVRESNEQTLRVLIRALEAKDRYTAGHSERVARYARYIGQELGLAGGRLERLRVAALCHDIGKLAVPNHLLNKPGRLTESEFARVKHHERVTSEILLRIDFLAPVAPTAGHRSGSDASAELPLEVSVIAVADAFDAMTSTRSYRRALTQEVAIAELRAGSGRQFDARCVEALERALSRRGEVHGAGHIEDAPGLFAAAPPVAGPGSAGLGDLEASGPTWTPPL
jgi:hypothetical protein